MANAYWLVTNTSGKVDISQKSLTDAERKKLVADIRSLQGTKRDSCTVLAQADGKVLAGNCNWKNPAHVPVLNAAIEYGLKVKEQPAITAGAAPTSGGGVKKSYLIAAAALIGYLLFRRK